MDSFTDWANRAIIPIIEAKQQRGAMGLLQRHLKRMASRRARKRAGTANRATATTLRRYQCLGPDAGVRRGAGECQGAVQGVFRITFYLCRAVIQSSRAMRGLAMGLTRQACPRRRRGDL